MGAELIYTVFRMLGSTICHQLPSRSIALGGLYLPLCARDTGIYLGIFLSTLFIRISGGGTVDKPPEPRYGIGMCLMMLPMLLDGFTSYLGLRTTTNDIRVFTGILFGIPIPFLLLPLLHYKLDAENKNSSIKGWTDIMACIGAAGLAALFLLNFDRIFLYSLTPAAIFFIWFLVSTIILFSVVFIVFTLCKVILINKVLSVGLTVLIFSALFCFSRFVLAPLVDILQLS